MLYHPTLDTKQAFFRKAYCDEKSFVVINFIQTQIL